MPEKKVALSREALGNKRLKYAAGVTREADGTFTLVVSSLGPKGEHCLPERPPFVAKDLDELDAQSIAFLRDWKASQPGSGDHILCCTKVVQNALAQARKKIIALAAGPVIRRVHGR